MLFMLTELSLPREENRSQKGGCEVKRQEKGGLDISLAESIPSLCHTPPLSGAAEQ